MTTREWDDLVDVALEIASAFVVHNLKGVHGLAHWGRVRQNGLLLAALTPGADAAVVEVFAAVHDTQRWDDGSDPRHGLRAADAVRELDERGQLGLTRKQVKLLIKACRIHHGSDGVDDPTLGCCLDADRLDLVRMGRNPRRSLMSTDAGREVAT